MSHVPRHLKVRNLERDPPIALVLQGGECNEIGMQQYLAVHGTGVVHIAVERIGGFCPWAEG